MRPLSSDDLRPNTMFLLMAQYNGAAVVPLVVCLDFFSHLTVEKLLRKALRSDIALPKASIRDVVWREHRQRRW